MKKIILIFIISIILISCSNKNISIEQINLKRNITIDNLNDTTFFFNVRALAYNNWLYFSDYKLNQIVKLDLNGKFISTVGSSGLGPGELLGTSQIFIKDDTIFALNEGKSTIEIFNQNKHLTTIPLYEEDIRVLNTSKFTYLKNKLYLSSLADNGSIVEYDLLNKSIKNFGIIDKYYSDNHSKFRNERELFIYNDEYIIAVPKVTPAIEKYNLQGELIERFEYKNIEPVKNRIDFINKQEVKPNSIHNIVNDASIYNDRLFILILSNNQEYVTSNLIMEVKIDDKMEITSIYNLGNGWFTSFAVAPSQIWTFDIKDGTLNQYMKDLE